MWRPHVSQLVAPLCLLAALRLPGWRPLVIAWVVALPIWVVGVYGIVRPGGYRGADAALESRLRALPSSAVVVTDEPGFPWRAGPPGPGRVRRRVGEAVRPGPHHRGRRATRRAGDPTRALSSSRPTSGSAACPISPSASPTRATSTVWRDGDRRLYVRPCRDDPRHRRTARQDSRRSRVQPRRSNQRSGRHAVDDPGERRHLGHDRQHDHDRERGDPGRLTPAEHHPEAQHGPDDVGAGVAQHHPLGQVVGQQRERRAHRRCDGDPRGAGAQHEGERHVGDEPELQGAPRRTVEEVAEVRGERDQDGIDEEASAAREARVSRPAPPRRRRRRTASGSRW